LHSDIVQACALHHDERHTESRPVRIAMLSDALCDLVALQGEQAELRHEHPAMATLDKLGLKRPQVEQVLRHLARGT
jgi:hypothetical protein